MTGTEPASVVSAVDPADRIHRAGSLTLSFDEINVRGRTYPMRAMATNVFESGGIRDEAGTAGIGAGAGALARRAAVASSTASGRAPK